MRNHLAKCMSPTKNLFTALSPSPPLCLPISICIANCTTHFAGSMQIRVESLTREFCLRTERSKTERCPKLKLKLNISCRNKDSCNRLVRNNYSDTHCCKILIAKPIFRRCEPPPNLGYMDGYGDSLSTITAIFGNSHFWERRCQHREINHSNGPSLLIFIQIAPTNYKTHHL